MFTNKAERLRKFITERYGAQVHKNLLENETVDIIMPAVGGGFLALTDQRIMYKNQMHEFEKEVNQVPLEEILEINVTSSFFGGTKLNIKTTKMEMFVKVVNPELANYVANKIEKGNVK